MSNRHPLLPNNPRYAILISALLALVLALGAPAHAAWSVVRDGANLTGAAAPLERAGTVCVNITALAPLLSLQAQVRDGVLTVTDSRGTTWRGTQGTTSLTSKTGATLSLRMPLLLQGSQAYLPVETVAEFAELIATSDSATQTITLARIEAQPSFSELADWKEFVVEKTAEERAQHTAMLGTERLEVLPLNQPAANGALRLNAGVGYVEGADWGVDLTGAGTIAGNALEFSGLFTQGDRGLRLEGGRMALTDSTGVTAELGDVYSDLWGSTNGLLLRPNTHQGDTTAFGVYFPSRSGSLDTPVLSYRDEFRLLPQWLLGGEVSTNGAYFLKTRYQASRLGLHGYLREMPDDDGDGHGVFATYDLGRGWSLYGGMSWSGDTTTSTWRNLSLRVPLVRGVDLALEHSRNEEQDRSNTVNAAMLSLGVGPANLLIRHQWGDSSSTFGDPFMVRLFDNRYRDLMTSTTYFVNSRLHFNFQTTTRWEADGSRSGNQEIVSSYRLSPRTDLQVISDFPHLTTSDSLRLRVAHQLQPDLALTAEYGQIAPYQQSIDGESGDHGFKVMLRRQFSIKTPAAGGTVHGRVVDQLGQPIPSAIVSVHSYQARTDAQGNYQMAHVPAGRYAVKLDEASLPANYQNRDARKAINVTNNTAVEADFHVIPLRAVTGVVYLDRNGNGIADPDEGVGNVVLHLNGFATATNDDGSFGFYNLAPGEHTVRVDKERLPRDLAVAVPDTITVTLQPDRSVTGVIFRLIKQEKPIIFQALL